MRIHLNINCVMIQNGTKSMFERDVNVKHLIEKRTTQKCSGKYLKKS